MQQRGYRYYNSQLGRWVSRDPIGEEQFAVSVGRGNLSQLNNLHLFVNNSPVVDSDMLGLWRIERDNAQNRARATADPGDTVLSLAVLAQLDESEFGKWLEPIDPLPLSAREDVTCRKFSIPNKVAIRRGYLDPWTEVPDVWLQFFDLAARTSVRVNAEARGFKVDVGTSTTWDEFVTILKDKDIHGVVYQGHGPRFQLVEPLSPTGTQTMDPSFAAAQLHHGLGVLMHLGCNSGGNNTLVSRHGFLIYHIGNTFPPSQLFDLSVKSGIYVPASSP
jgi:RHS repeat-associated protein